MQGNAFAPVGVTVNLAVLATTSSVALTSLGGLGGTVRIANVGTQTIFITFGGSTITTATTTGMPIVANTAVNLDMGTATHVAAIAGATGSTLYATSGQGG